MSNYIPRWFPLLVLILLLYSPFSQLTGLLNVLQGQLNNLSVSHDGLFTRAIREMLLLITYAYWFGWHLLHRRSPFQRLSKSSAIAICLGTGMIIVYSGLSIIATGAPMLLLAHLKFIEYFPLAAMLYTYFKRYESYRPIVTPVLHGSLVAMIGLQFLVGIVELLVIPPFYGQTILGPRVMGLYESPNSLSLTVMLMWLALFILDFRKPWLDGMVALLLLMAGSRTSLICFATLIMFSPAWRLTPRSRLLVQSMALLALPMLLAIASNKAISGRSISGEGRLGVLTQFIDTLTGPDIFIGQGWGISSNVLISLYGKQALDKLFVADSMYIYMISNFGFVGIVLVTLFAVLYWSRLKAHQRRYAALVAVAVLLASISVVLIEAYPANLILVFLLAYIITKPENLSIQRNSA